MNLARKCHTEGSNPCPPTASESSLPPPVSIRMSTGNDALPGDAETSPASTLLLTWREITNILLAKGHVKELHQELDCQNDHRDAALAARDRLLDLLFSDPQQCPQISRDQCRQRIHLTQQDGKRWRYLIKRVGYKLLLCLPPGLTDNRFALFRILFVHAYD